MIRSAILGCGHYVPENIITNQWLSERIDTTDEWIVERTGIRERRYFSPGKDTVANMAARASKDALSNASLQASDIDFIVFATITPDYYFPGSGVLLQRELDIPNIGALDIRNQCSGFIFALSVADQFIRSGMYKNILVVGAEIQSSAIDMSDRGRNMAVIFADGAGAVVLSATTKHGQGILTTHLHGDGNFAEELIMKDPGSSRPKRMYGQMQDLQDTFPYMNGNMVFKHAVTKFEEVILEALKANNFQIEDIDLLIPHQANIRITQYIGQKMNIAPDKIVSNIEYYGNTTSASIPIALSEACAAGRLRESDLLCLAAFGSGFTWASALIRW